MLYTDDMTDKINIQYVPNQTIVCSAFPGTGKTSLCKNAIGATILDSDSSKFDKENFPANYIDYIRRHSGKADVILVSSHKAVRNALVENGIDFFLIYPKSSLKEEYLERYRQRGNTEDFIALLDENWDAWLLEMAAQKGCRHCILESNVFLSDIIKTLIMG